MKVIQVNIQNSLKNFNYILYSEMSKDAIFFDPTDFSKTSPFIKSLGLNPKYLINTHRHFDHIADNEKFLQETGAKHLKLKHGEEFHLSSEEKILCLDTPGHVSDHQCFFLYEKNIMTGVISGDTVFTAGVGNCKNGGDVDDLFETIKNIFVPLEDHIKIYTSHDNFVTNLKFAKSIEKENPAIKEFQDILSSLSEGKFYISTIGEEKKYNPFFRVFESGRFSSEVEQRNEFKRIRKLRDSW